MDSALVAKICVLILLAVLKLIFGLMPMGLAKLVKKGGMEWLDKLMSYVMCFGGGVLLATIFLHIQPEVRDFIEAGRIENGSPPYQPGDFPIADLIFCGGFFIVYLCEASVQKIFNIHHHSHGLPTSSSDHHHSLRRKSSTHTCHSHETFSQIRDANGTKHPKPIDGETAPSVVENGKPQQVSEPKAKDRKLLSTIRSFIIVVALSVHAIFEGLAIGLQLSATDVWMLFLAVSIHECAILFCIGNEMVSNNIGKRKILMNIGALGFVTPIGTIIGIVLTLQVDNDPTGGSQSMVIGVLQGLAGGTLLYITFFEVLERDKLEEKGTNGILGTLTIILGFAFMTGLTVMDMYLVPSGSTNGTITTTTMSPSSVQFF